MNRPSTHHAGPRFEFGRILATPSALEVIADANVSIVDLLIRHLRGDWSDLSDSDLQQNELAVTAGQRITSSYLLPSGRTVWITTEADRYATTFLLPGEY
ncbi:putative adenine-specific DNA methylase [Burkholderia pseudomallei MSHR4012]|nr:hypothetical protein [Burkholderia pseudomallei]KGS99200.1 putative adenine-specific DNA methylase [Burkholderia pseudomallei]KGV12831.1 putative type I restriction-modification system methyltransferase subunit [Burkholderia pseudomallei MSHR4300]KGV45220.1 putative adenine-specific DNA methylase [Burkholderia pseudomallei MSHR4012]KGV51607.1 putative type I restriction-modification system methyltransferase subunit [Burkholderia pseudomallei MSHR4003]KGW11173.1 putative type I restriction-m